MIELKNKLSVLVPSKIGTEQIDTTEIVNALLSELSERYGGASITDLKGAWLSEQNGLITEDVKQVWAYSSDSVQLIRQHGLTIAKSLKKQLRQDSVAIEINNRLLLV